MKLDVLSTTLGASLDREQSLPARGGSYDRLSVPLMANIKGSRTYKKALQLASRKLFVELYSGSNETSLARQASSRNRIDAIERIIHTAAHIASYPGRHEYIAIPLSPAQYSPKGAFPDLSYRAVKSLIERLSSPSIEQQEPFVFIKPGTWNKETQEGLVTRLHILRPFMDWMAREGLVFPNHPYGLRSSGEMGRVLFSPGCRSMALLPSQDLIRTVIPKFWNLTRDINFVLSFLPFFFCYSEHD